MFEKRTITTEQAFPEQKKSSKELDQVWAREAESRLEAFKHGQLKKIPAELVLGK